MPNRTVQNIRRTSTSKLETYKRVPWHIALQNQATEEAKRNRYQPLETVGYSWNCDRKFWRQ